MNNVHHKTEMLTSFSHDGDIIGTINSLYLKVKIHPKLLVSQSKFSDPRKFTLRYQQFDVTEIEI